MLAQAAFEAETAASQTSPSSDHQRSGGQTIGRIEPTSSYIDIAELGRIAAFSNQYSRFTNCNTRNLTSVPRSGSRRNRYYSTEPRIVNEPDTGYNPSTESSQYQQPTDYQRAYQPKQRNTDTEQWQGLVSPIYVNDENEKESRREECHNRTGRKMNEKVVETESIPTHLLPSHLTNTGTAVIKKKPGRPSKKMRQLKS